MTVEGKMLHVCIKRPKFEHTSTIPEQDETQGFLFGKLFL